MELDLATAIAPCLEERSRMKGVLKFIRNRVRKGRSKGRIRMAKGKTRVERKKYMGRKEIFHQHQVQGQRREGNF